MKDKEYNEIRAELEPGITTDGDESGALTIGIDVYPLPFDAARWIKTDCLPYDMTPFRFPHAEDLTDGH